MARLPTALLIQSIGRLRRIHVPAIRITNRREREITKLMGSRDAELRETMEDSL
jgi:hypothetical protein